jgi:hypothetical protein
MDWRKPRPQDSRFPCRHQNLWPRNSKRVQSNRKQRRLKGLRKKCFNLFHEQVLANLTVEITREERQSIKCNEREVEILWKSYWISFVSQNLRNFMTIWATISSWKILHHNILIQTQCLTYKTIRYTLSLRYSIVRFVTLILVAH